MPRLRPAGQVEQRPDVAQIGRQAVGRVVEGRADREQDALGAVVLVERVTEGSEVVARAVFSTGSP